MQRVRVLLGLLAAIILMVGGAPASASSNPCNPCPPDCPMMAQMAATAQGGAAADHPHQAPGKSGKADNPCKSTAVCQSAFAVPLLAQTAVETVLLAETAEHDLVGALAAPSRPPDPTLRPPIQL
jgi:hypothetical protein